MRLIDAEQLITELEIIMGIFTTKEIIRGICVSIGTVKKMATVEAKEVLHAEWRHLGGDEWCCTECGYVISTEGSWEKPKAKFCEECGADMRTSAE